MTEIEKSQREFMDSIDMPIQFADEGPSMRKLFVIAVVLVYAVVSFFYFFTG